MLRLTVIATSASRSSASLPVQSVPPQVDEEEVRVRAAGEDVEAARLELAEKASAFARTCRW